MAEIHYMILHFPKGLLKKEKRRILFDSFMRHAGCEGMQVLQRGKGSCIVEDKEGTCRKLYYSNTYQEETGICVYSEKYRIGVDLEKIEKVEKIAGMWDSGQSFPPIFAHSRSLDGRWRSRLTVWWCIQEAAGKLEGTGLACCYRIEKAENNIIIYESRGEKKTAELYILERSGEALVLVCCPA